MIDITTCIKDTNDDIWFCSSYLSSTILLLKEEVLEVSGSGSPFPSTKLFRAENDFGIFPLLQAFQVVWKIRTSPGSSKAP